MVTPFPNEIPSANFPPRADILGTELEMKIIKHFCDNLAPSSFEEASCTVCGQLSICHGLLPLKSIKNLLHILEAPGVTCVECKSDSEKLHEYKGPVLDHGCNMVCAKC